MEIGKIPPQAIDIEEAVLSALLIDKDSIINVLDILKPESFYKSSNQLIYKSILSLYNDNKAIDLLTVKNKLHDSGDLNEVGGISKLSELTQIVSSSHHIEAHARIVQQKFLQREIIRVGSGIVNTAYDDLIDVDDLINFAESEIFEVTSENVKKGVIKIGDIGENEMDKISKMQLSDTEFTGVRSGFDEIDKCTGGFQNSDLIIIASRPSMGKTALAVSMMINSGISFENKVALFSLEMSKEQIWQRSISNLTEIDSKRLRTKNSIDVFEWGLLEKANKMLKESNIYIDDTAALTVNEIRSKCRKLKMKKGLDIVIVDYLQLMQGKREKNGNREQEISSISRGLKILAKELNIPVICLSQLNRAVESRPDKRPQLSDLRESGAIEQDADIVAFIHRPEYYGFKEYESGEPTKNIVEIIFSKHRNGSLGDFKLLKTNGFTKIY